MNALFIDPPTRGLTMALERHSSLSFMHYMAVKQSRVAPGTVCRNKSLQKRSLTPPPPFYSNAAVLLTHLSHILAEGAIALSVTLSGGALFAS